MKKLLVMMAVCALGYVSAPAWAQVKFEQLTSPIQSWSNYALSRDGKVMAANIGGEIFAGLLQAASSTWDWETLSIRRSEFLRTATRS